MNRLFTFRGGDAGPWVITRITAVAGEILPLAGRLLVTESLVDIHAPDPGAAWHLRGITSNERYTMRPEKTELVARQAALGRPEATFAALIPIRKNPAWWVLTQDERRAIFEEQSHHVRIGMNYLPGVARRLHHCRDLGEHEPFDFLTFFDYAEADVQAFEDMVGELRRTEEWKYVDREVDVRLVRD